MDKLITKGEGMNKKQAIDKAKYESRNGNESFVYYRNLEYFTCQYEELDKYDVLNRDIICSFYNMKKERCFA